VAFVAAEWFTDMEVLGSLYDVQREIKKKFRGKCISYEERNGKCWGERLKLGAGYTQCSNEMNEIISPPPPMPPHVLQNFVVCPLAVA
jgi:hypothetical protein